MSWSRSDKNRLDGTDASAGWGTRRSHKPGMVTGPPDGAQTDPSGAASAFRRAVLGCWARAGEMPSASGSARGFLPGRHRSPRHRDVGARRRPRGPRPRRRPAHREPEPGRALPERTARAVLAADPPCPGRAEDRRPRGAERRGGGAARVGARSRSTSRARAFRRRRRSSPPGSASSTSRETSTRSPCFSAQNPWTRSSRRWTGSTAWPRRTRRSSPSSRTPRSRSERPQRASQTARPS